MDTNKPILVTGIPRSGTTWVGRTLSMPSNMRYIHEPFNISNSPCICGFKTPFWFYYVTYQNENYVKTHMDHILGSPLNGKNIINTFREFMISKRIRGLFENFSNLQTNRTILKDPLSLLSSEWLVRTYNLDVIILIRHPAAVVSSYKRLDWEHSFSHFIKQEALMEDHLYPFEDQIHYQIKSNTGPIHQIALLWKILHYMILKYRKKYKDWIYLRYEDIALQPQDKFIDLFQALGLEISDHTLKLIQKNSARTNPVYANNPYSINRSSKQLVDDWKMSLSKVEINRIRDIVEDISFEFYDTEDW